jgi:hypothetical protein
MTGGTPSDYKLVINPLAVAQTLQLSDPVAM